MTRLVFIMAGQSNMSGRAPLAGAPVSVNGSRIFRWLQDDSGTWVQNPVEPMDLATGEALSVAIDTDAAFGPQLAFADHMATLRPLDEIGLLSVAKGGSSIKNWQPDWGWASLYGATVRRAMLVQDQGYTIAGLCFWQGETDAQSAAAANDWGAGFTAMVRSLREDLGSPSLPVAFCRLGANPGLSGYPAWDEVRRRQWTMRGPGLKWVDLDGIPMQSDKLHATQAGYITAGQRMADAMDALL